MFVIAYTPASFIAAYVPNMSGNKVSLGGVTGTLFSGESEQLVAQGLVINNVSWNLSPWSLFLLKPQIDIKGGNIRQSDDIYIKGNVSTSLLALENVNAENMTILVPTKTVLSQFKLPVFVSASGRFRVDIKQLQFENGCKQLQGKGSWLNAAIRVNKKDIDFGSFEAILSCESPAFVLQVQPQNKLSLDAKLNIDMNGKYKINGQYKVNSDLPAEIQEAAQFFGKAQGDGVYTISF